MATEPTVAPSPRTYAPRRPEDTVLHGVVHGSLETFLATARRGGGAVPRFVERELRAFLACGVLAHGFLRVRCPACRHERLVPFSCKRRGFCPSCGGRRMADTAAHLVDRVLPEVPVRQWVLSLPFALRYRLGYDAALTSEVLRLFVRTVFASLRRRARLALKAPPRVLHGGAVTFIQRFGDALNLNVHFHSLVLDGVYVDQPGAPRFLPLPPPTHEEIERVVRQIAGRLARLLEHRGLGPRGAMDEPDPLAADDALLAALYAASVRGRAATGPRAGQGVLRLGDRVDPADLEPGAEEAGAERCATAGGLSLHADVAVPARDRRRLERLCRYVARPPLATERLGRLPDGRLLYRLRHRWRDGTTHMVFTPLELIERLAALVPPPRANQVRYHGVLGPCAALRDRIVPPAARRPRHARHRDARREAGAPEDQRGDAATPRAAPSACSRGAESRSPTPWPDVDEAGAPAPHPRRYTWPELMQRVFAIDVLECPRCHGPMRIIAEIHPPGPTRAILEHLGLPARAPPWAPPPPELRLGDIGIA